MTVLTVERRPLVGTMLYNLAAVADFPQGVDANELAEWVGGVSSPAMTNCMIRCRELGLVRRENGRVGVTGKGRKYIWHITAKGRYAIATKQYESGAEEESDSWVNQCAGQGYIVTPVDDLCGAARATLIALREDSTVRELSTVLGIAEPSMRRHVGVLMGYHLATMTKLDYNGDVKSKKPRRSFSLTQAGRLLLQHMDQRSGGKLNVQSRD